MDSLEFAAQMNLLEIVFAELRYRWVSALLSTLLTAAGIACVVFFLLLSQVVADRTRLIQRDMGLNLRIIPAETNLDQYWLKGYSDGLIDESLLGPVEEQEVANRLVPMLQRTIPWGPSEAILTGLGQERFARGESRKPVFGAFDQAADELTIGALAAERQQLKEGDRVTVLDREFTIARILASNGSVDDLRVYAALKTVQAMLELPGKLNEIRALECRCDPSIADPEQHLRSILEPMLPGTRVIRQDRLADARRKQLELAERIGLVTTPILVLFTALTIGISAVLNAYQRRGEIGTLVTIGDSSLRIGLLIWLRAVFLGFFGGLVGTLWGSLLLGQGATFFVGAGGLPNALPLWQVLLGSVLGSVLASSAALVPAVLATRLDPASTLRAS